MIQDPLPELSLWLRDRGMLTGTGNFDGSIYVEQSTEVSINVAFK